jgi:Xaa-Pro aminopeptidase
MERGGWLIRVYLSHGSSTTDLVNDPMYAFSTETPKPGDLVRAACFGPWRRGYYMDPIRTAVCGRKATSEQKRLVETCVAIVNAMISKIKPGTRVLEVAELANKMRTGSGYDTGVIGEMWPNCWGHGLGLFWEEPWIISELCTENDVYEENMVIGVEAFLAAEGIGIAGVEENLIITKNGTELLTTMPQTWW